MVFSSLRPTDAQGPPSMGNFDGLGVEAVEHAKAMVASHESRAHGQYPRERDPLLALVGRPSTLLRPGRRTSIRATGGSFRSGSNRPARALLYPPPRLPDTDEPSHGGNQRRRVVADAVFEHNRQFRISAGVATGFPLMTTRSATFRPHRSQMIVNTEDSSRR